MFERSMSTASKSSSEGLQASRPLRVMVVDDHPDTVLTLLALLRDEGCDAKGFGSGREALRALKEFDPDVVISDVAMPSVNGWDVAREVRQAMGRSRPLLIAITGQYTKNTDKLLADIAGFNHYLTKPCDPTALLALLAPLRSPN